MRKSRKLEFYIYLAGLASDCRRLYDYQAFIQYNVIMGYTAGLPIKQVEIVFIRIIFK